MSPPPNERARDYTDAVRRVQAMEGTSFNFIWDSNPMIEKQIGAEAPGTRGGGSSMGGIRPQKGSPAGPV
jgi:hypothetical protein